MTRLALPSLLLTLIGCTDQEVVVIKADAGAQDAGDTSPKKDGSVDQPPTGTVTDSGVAGRRLGDRGCKTNEDCDSNLCSVGLDEAQNYCTVSCTPETAKTVCVKPLSGGCSRTFLCNPPE